MNKTLLLYFWLMLAGMVSTVRGESITLEQAYDRAMETDQSVAIAYTEAAKARLESALALTRMTPRLNSGINTKQNGDLNQRTAADGSSNDAVARTAGLTLSQPILDFTVRPAYEAGKISARASMIDYQGKLRDTLLAVATAYFDVLTQQKLVAIYRESLRLAKEQEALATARKRVGEVLQTDVLKSNVAVQRAQRTTVEAENTLKLRRSILANILNLGIEAEISVVEPVAFPFIDETLTSTVQRAQRQREDLQSATLNIDKKVAAHQETKAQYYPLLSADAGVSRDYADSHSRETNQSNWRFGFSLSIPWFSGGERDVKLQRAALDITQAKLDQEKVSKAVAENVEEAWLQVRTLQQNLVGLKVEVASAEENYRLLQQQYNAGEVKNLDVIQALNDLNTSRTDLAVQSYQYELGLRDLARRTANFEDERVQQALQRRFQKTSKQ